MARSLIPVGNGEHRTSPPLSEYIYTTSLVFDRVLASSSGSPFETEIGTGKVIKGWDEGEFENVERECFA